MQILCPSERVEDVIALIPTEELLPCPYRTVQESDAAGLRALALSLRRRGVQRPLSVRRRPEGYEVVDGERRRAAAALAGLRELPCVALELEASDSGAAALAVHLRRVDLDAMERAQGIGRLIRLFGLSREECARRLGMDRDELEALLAFRRLPETAADALREAALTERHARALLRLPDEAQMRAALRHISARDLSAENAERYIDGLLPAAGDERARFVLKDVRVFLNSLRRSVDLMRRGGVDVAVEEEETEEELRVMIRIRR